MRGFHASRAPACCGRATSRPLTAQITVGTVAGNNSEEEDRRPVRVDAEHQRKWSRLHAHGRVGRRDHPVSIPALALLTEVIPGGVVPNEQQRRSAQRLPRARRRWSRGPASRPEWGQPGRSATRSPARADDAARGAAEVLASRVGWRLPLRGYRGRPLRSPGPAPDGRW